MIDLSTRNVSRYVALSIAVAAATLCFATSASAFSVNQFTTTVSTSQALAHPDLKMDLRLNASSSERLRSLQVDLPVGVIANPQAVTAPCTEAQFAALNCPATAQIGTASTTASLPWYLFSLPLTVPGTLYMMESDGGGLPSVAAILTPGFPFPKQGMKMSLSIRGDYGATGSVHDIPNNVLGIPMTLTRLQMTLSSRAGANASGDYFVTNPSSCGTKQVNAVATTYNGASASASSTFSTTGCESVAFEPELDVAFSSTVPNTNTEMSATVAIPPGNGYLRRLVIRAPRSLGVNFPELAISCSPTVFNERPWDCPPESVIGTFSATTPLLANPVDGSIFVVDASPVPRIGAYAYDPFTELSISALAQVSAPDGDRFVITMPVSVGLPQLPLSSVNLTIGATAYHGSPLRIAGATTCFANDVLDYTATSWTGASVTASKAVPMDPSCQAVYEPPIEE